MDYANRKRPPKRKPTSGKRGAKAQPQRQVPWAIVILAVVLVVALVGGLRFIAGGKDGADGQLPNEVITETPSVSSGPALEPMPEKPEERWQYIEELENLEVEVDVPERELGPPKLMQCGSFRKRSDAERLRAAIALQGLESQVYPSNNNTWFRVVLGPYETKRDAEAERHILQRARIHGCQIWNWNL